MDYYKEKQYLAQVDKENNVIGKVERWEAHKKQILHRGFSVCLLYKGQALLQHRKHLLFDGTIDLTGSSHPVYIGDTLESNEDAVFRCLEREWEFNRGDLASPLVDKGTFYYQADDALTEYGEHEVCYLYTAEVENIPQFSPEYAYGYSLVDIDKLKNSKFPLTRAFTPWTGPSIALL